jgi:type IV pilus assembly protein PilB
MQAIEIGNKEQINNVMLSLSRDRFLDSGKTSSLLGRSIPPANAITDILQHASLEPQHRVLQVGTGAGYLTALLSQLAAEVVAIEADPAIAASARERFDRLGLTNLLLLEGNGVEGTVDMAPFDRILVSSPRVTDKSALLDQLALGGSLLAIELGEANVHILARYSMTELGATVRKELTLVDFSQDTSVTLLDMGVVDQEMLTEAGALARRKHLPVIEVVRDMLNIEDTTLYRRLAKENGMSFASAEEVLQIIKPQLVRTFSLSFLESNHLIPFRSEDRSLYVATDDPDSEVADIYHMYPFDRVIKTLVTPGDFRRLWTRIELCLDGDADAVLNVVGKPEETTGDLLKHDKTDAEAHLITLIDALLLDAVSEGASDIHIEPYRDKTRIRLRVDGDLHDLPHYHLSAPEARGLVNVIKIRGDMDIAEKRLPQGGRSQLSAGGAAYDLRIQIQPSLHGESAVIRLLPREGNIVAIEKLGLSDTVSRDYRRLLASPAGLVLVVGPTGSGKTTTLYAGLSELAKDGRRKVITIEDPIEYSMNNIEQTRTRPEIGFGFADGMRSFVRQDPDVILVGEIRDFETAVEAIRASQTGHVVLSTLHSNDAVDAIQRICDLEVHPNSLASELMAVIAQKLAKRICPHCKTETVSDPEILAEVFPEGAPFGFKSYRGSGCESCNGRGTRGRVAVVEFMQVNAELRDAISERLPVARLRSIALDSGLITMRDSALDHVIQGVIPLTELPRILPVDRMAPEKRGEW